MELHLHFAALARGPDAVGDQRQEHLRQQRLAAFERQMVHVGAVREADPGQVGQPGGLIRHALADHGQVKALLAGEGFVVQLLGQLGLAGQAEHLKDQAVLVGQVLLQTVQQAVVLQDLLHFPLGRGKV